MRDPFDSDDAIDGSELQGGFDAGQVTVGNEGSPGNMTSGGGVRDDLPSESEIIRETEILTERFEGELLTPEEQAELDEEMEEWQAEEDAYMEELAEQEAAKDAARAEAHANGEAFYEGDVRWNGEDCQEWTLPDGTTVIVNEAGEAVSVQWPDGEGPVYIGDVLVGGEPHAVYELPTGTQIVVDEDGNTIDTLDDVDVDDTSVPLMWITGDKNDADEMVTVEVVPDPDGSYDTHVVDAETGEVLKELDTGSEALGYNVGETGTDGQEIYQTYVPPGSDHYIVIDSDGNVVGTHPVPQEPEWSVLGIVEYYEGGEIVVDLGATDVSVDVVGPDGGISVGFDVLVAEGTAGVEWEEDGSWEFSTSVDVDAGAAAIELDTAVGQDGDGMWHLDVETWMEMKTGGLDIEGGQHFHFQETDEGSEWNVGWEGKVSSFGFYVERAQDFTAVFDDDGSTLTYQDMVGAGHSLMGGVQVTSENQIRVSEDGEIEGTTGVHGRIVDSDGDEIIGGGTYLDSEQGGPMSQSEQLDTGRDYERQYDDGRPAGPDVDDDEAMGAGEVGRFDLGRSEDDDDEDGATGERRERLERIDDDGVAIDRGDAPAIAGTAARSAVPRDDEAPTMPPRSDAPEPPDAVVAAIAGRFADTGDSARHLLADAPGSDRFITFGSETGLAHDHPVDGVASDSDAEPQMNPTDTRDGDRFIAFGEETTTAREGVELGVENSEPRADGLYSTSSMGTEVDSPPDTSGAQLASDPPPADEETPPVERPKIFTKRDSDAKTPDDEGPADPEPTPTPTGERPKLFERDDAPKDDDPDAGPDGPTIRPDLFTERFHDTDEDGDGPFDPLDPIGSDDTTLADIVTGGPPTGSTVAATPDQSSGTIDRPDADNLLQDTLTKNGAFSTPGMGAVVDGRPDTSGAQLASDPPPADEETPPVERPKIFTDRDSDARTPDDEPTADPEPTPTTPGERPRLFERDNTPDDDTDDGPDGPTIRPDLFTERFHDTDEDGDGPFDPLDPIGSDDTTLADIVTGGPPTGSTVAATPDQSSDTIDRPDADGLMMDGTTMEAQRRADGLMSADASTMEAQTRVGEVSTDGSRPTAPPVQDIGAEEFIGETEKNLDIEVGDTPTTPFEQADVVGVRKASDEAHVDVAVTADPEGTVPSVGTPVLNDDITSAPRPPVESVTTPIAPVDAVLVGDETLTEVDRSDPAAAADTEVAATVVPVEEAVVSEMDAPVVPEVEIDVTASIVNEDAPESDWIQYEAWPVDDAPDLPDDQLDG